MNKICLFGASGHGKVVKEVASSIDINVEVFIDDSPKHKFIHKIPVIISNEASKYEGKDLLISIGNNLIRKEVSEKLNNSFTKLIHKSAIVSSTANILKGTVVMAGVIINADTQIGKHTIINTNAIIEHDCKIEDYVHVSPNATITGNVIIGEGTHIGAGAIILPNISIGKWVTIGAGSVVLDNVPDFATVVGNPARIIKYNKDE